MSLLALDQVNRQNRETPRVSDLVPDQIRSDASVFINLLEDYYKFLNSDASSGLISASKALNEIVDEHDIDEVSMEFIDRIQALIASYIPSSRVLDRQTLYKRIVKYYYSSRGSRESVPVFFRIFFGQDCGLTDPATNAMLETWLTGIGTPTQQIPIGESAWRPYSYVMTPGMPIEEWEVPYRAIVHPAGFKFFAIIIFTYLSVNKWNALNPDIASVINDPAKLYYWIDQSDWNYLSETLADWFIIATGGDHSPTSQPGYLGVYLKIVAMILASDDGGRMDHARYDYQYYIKFWDTTPIWYFKDYVLSDASADYDFSGYFKSPRILPHNGYAEFYNVGMILSIDGGLTSLSEDINI